MKQRDESKLPQWVRDQLESLRREIASLENAVKEACLKAGPPGSRVQIYKYSDGAIPLPEKTTVRFYLGKRLPSDRLPHWVDVRLNDGKLHVMGDQALVVHPCVTNVVEIERVDP